MIIVAVTSCQWFSSHKYSDQREQDEDAARTFLEQARQEFSEGRYDDARRTISVMRDSCRYALNAREQGILLLDSIELFQVRNDTAAADRDVKERFYLKKLEHDRKGMKSHE